MADIDLGAAIGRVYEWFVTAAEPAKTSPTPGATGTISGPATASYREATVSGYSCNTENGARAALQAFRDGKLAENTPGWSNCFVEARQVVLSTKNLCLTRSGDGSCIQWDSMFYPFSPCREEYNDRRFVECAVTYLR